MMNYYILPLFSLLVAVVIFFGYVRPTWSDTISAAKDAIASDEQSLVAAKEYSTQQNILTDARNAINPADLARLAVFLPDSVDNVGLILDLNALAVRSGLSISNIDVTTNTVETAVASDALPAAQNQTGSIELSLSAVGTYSALQSFLVGVEKSQRLLDVRDIIVKGSETGVYSYQMKLRLFWIH
jgi:Tfp pilus assembly protein PilO